MTNPRIGVLTFLKPGEDPFPRVRDFGLGVCQLASWEPGIWTEALAATTRAQAADAGVRIVAFWAGWSGKAVWDFAEGPATLGIVPRPTRAERVRELMLGVDFAHRLGIRALATHIGFVPENPGDPLFDEVVEVVKTIARRLDGFSMELWLETGQETPVTLLRLIKKVGTGNVGLNLDPANLILYGKASPVDAVEIFASGIRNVHAKDGLYPTDPMRLGTEVKVGQGRVRFPEFVRRLEEQGFRGEYIIEREITGSQQDADIRETVDYLDRLLGGAA